MKLSFLVDNKTEHSRCQAEWGLSIFVESCGHKILFDTGCSDMFARNAKVMNIDLAEAEAAIISHGHYDHTEGMPAFVEINKNAPIYIHRNAFSVFHGTKADVIDDYNCGILWSKEFTASIRERLVLTSNVVKINDNMTLIGNIPDFEEYPLTEKFYKEVQKECAGCALEPDDMSHEQFLVINEGEKIYIISGCSHRGVLPTILTAQKHFPDKKIGGLIAGMHMYPLDDETRKKMVQQIIGAGVEKVFPLHCTGMAAIIEFKTQMGENCIVAAAGDVYEL